MDMNVSFRIAAGVTGQQAVDALKTSMEKLGDTANVVGKGTLSLANNFTALSNPIDFATGLLGKFAGAAGLAGAVAGIVKLTSSAIDTGAALATLSIKTGISVETLSRFSTVAKLADTDMETVANTLKKISNSAVDAATGNQKLSNLFKAVGVDVRDANGGIKAADELLIDLARAVQGLNPELATKLMSELGGKSGANIIPFLRELTERLDQTKVKFDEAFAKNAKEYNDNLILLQGNIAGIGRALASELLPSLIRVTDEMVKAKDAGVLTQLWRGLTGVVVEATTDFKNIEVEIDTVNKRLTTLRGTLETLQNQGTFSKWWNSDDIAIVKKQIEMNEQSLRMLESQRQRVEENAPLNPKIDPIKSRAVEAAIATNNVGTADPFTTELQNLGREAARNRFNSEHIAIFQDRITSAKEAMIQFDVEQGKFKDLTNDQKAALLEAARQVDKYGLSLKENLAGLEYEKQTKRVEAETRALGEGVLVKQQILALQDLENRGIKEGSALYERLKSERMSALQTQYDESRTFAMGMKQFVSSYVDDATNGAKQVRDAMSSAFNAASDALVDFVMTGKFNFASLATSILKDLARIAIQRSIMAPLVGALSGFIPGLAGLGAGGAAPVATAYPITSANGNVFSGGSLQAFADGGVVGSPTFFPMANGGAGLMGEAGPEAIMPLSRDSSGRLGVKSQGGGDQYNISVSVATDGSTSSKGNSQSGEGLGRAIAGAVRQEIMNQKRPGGLLAPGAMA